MSQTLRQKQFDWWRDTTGETVPAFAPSDVTQLKLWLKADAGAFQTLAGLPATANADPVGEWRDQSGNGIDVVQAVSTKRPTIVADGKNGRVTMLADGVTHTLISVAVATTARDDFTGFIVYKHITGVSSHSIFSNGSSNGFAFGPISGNRTVWLNGIASWTDDAYTLETWEIASFRRAAGTMTLNINGVDQAVTNPTSTPSLPTTNVAVFSRNNALFANSEVAEILLYAAALSNVDRLRVETYLNTRWAVF